MKNMKLYIWPLLLLTFFLVNATYANQILVTPQEAIVKLGGGQKFEAQLFGSENKPVITDVVQWKVMPENLGTITDDGFFIAGRNPGQGEIFALAKYNGKLFTGKAHIIVGAPQIPDIKIIVQPEIAVVPPSGQKTFKAVAVSADGVSLRKHSVRWFVDPPAMGKINSMGVFHAGSKSGQGKIIALVEIDNHVYRGSARIVVGEQPTASISGSVTEEAGTILSGAVVTATRLGVPHWRQRVETDENGIYVINNLLPGDYIVRSEMAGYLPEYYDGVQYLNEATPLKLAENDSLVKINFSLGIGGSISGNIMADNMDTTDDVTKPLEGAHIVATLRVQPKIKYHTISDADGNFKLEGLNNGSYVVWANKAGYIAEYYDNVMNYNEATWVDVEVPNERSGIDFSLGTTSAIRGIVVNEEDGSPIVGARVSVATLINTLPRRFNNFIHTVRTNEKGEYAFQLRPGIYLVYANADSFAGEWYENQTDPVLATPVQVTEEQHTEVIFELPALGGMHGQVVDTLSGDPIAGAIIHAFSEQKMTKRAFKAITDDQGNYSLGALPAGDYIVRAHAEDYLPEFYFEADSLKNATLVTVQNKKQTPDINFTLATGAKISGLVTDQETNEPLVGSFVNIIPQNGYSKRIVKTNEEGFYEIGGLRQGTYLARARTRQYLTEWYDEATSQTDATPIDLATSELRDDVHFTLLKSPVPGSGITGIVTDDSTGNPVEGAIIAVMPFSFAKPKHTVSGEDGTFELNLVPGVYIAICFANGYVGEFYDNVHRWFKAQPITISENRLVSDIDFALTPQVEGAYLIAGSVRDSKGNPMEGALVVAKENDEVVAAGLSEVDGTYVLSDLPAGTYKVSASVTSFDDGYYDGDSPETSADIKVGMGENTYDATILVSQTTTDVEQVNSLPATFSLLQNYPNPFNPVTQIQFTLPVKARISLVVYNILGKKVKTLYNGTHEAGSFFTQWNGTDNQGNKLSSGIYYYRLEAKSKDQHFQQIRRMTMLK